MDGGGSWDMVVSVLHRVNDCQYMYIRVGKKYRYAVYRGIFLAWYVPRHTCPYRILVFLFIVTENLKSPKY